MAITEFQGEHRWLSNFWVEPLWLGGVEWPSAEHAYQASKFVDAGFREEIRQAETPGQAKRMGQVTDREMVADFKKSGEAAGTMARILMSKFTPGSALARKLMATGTELLVEGNTWHDNYWGVCTCEDCAGAGNVGDNFLGKVLMTTRGWCRRNAATADTLLDGMD